MTYPQWRIPLEVPFFYSPDNTTRPVVICQYFSVYCVLLCHAPKPYSQYGICAVTRQYFALNYAKHLIY